MALVLALFLALAAASPKPAVTTPSDDVALRGYEAIVYFTDGHADRGLPQFETRWNGARWRFGTATHRDAFVQAPAKHAPRFGGHCAWAVAHGYTPDGDPKAWKIVDGRLCVNYSKRVQRKWEENIPEYTEQGQANWPAVPNK